LATQARLKIATNAWPWMTSWNPTAIPGNIPKTIKEATMNYLHYAFHVRPDEAVEVVLDRQANVRLLDDANYHRYQRGEQHTFYGGLAQVSPVHLRPPHPG